MSLAEPSVDADFTRSLPKIELHAHLSGSISRKCLHQVWLMKKASEPNLAIEDPLVAMPAGKVDYDLQSFFPLFSSYIYKLCSDVPSIQLTTNSVLDDFLADNVTYLELRTTPRDIPQHGITKASYVDTVLACIRAHNDARRGRMTTNLILSVDRRMTAADADAVVDLAIANLPNGVVGLDICGNPSAGDVATFTPAFARARSAGLKLTLHFGEVPNPPHPSELETLLAWQPHRLGHVIHVEEDMRRRIVRAGIGVELCLTCNVVAKMTPGGGSYAEHHFGWWRGKGVGVALSTDDVGVFCSPLSEEYRLAMEHFGLGRADVKELCLGAVDIIFAEEEEKERLRMLYRSWPG